MKDQGGGGALLLLGGGFLVWFLVSEPRKDVANWFWPDSPAPWEKVDAFYYPDINDLAVWEQVNGLASLDACRAWVQSQATLRGDPTLLRGDYECGVGQLDSIGTLSVYRLTLE